MKDRNENAWERQQNEPELWYKRFTYYRLLGVGRSIDEAYRSEEATKGHKKPRTARAGKAWHNASKQWNWEARANAWDHAQLAAEENAWQERRERWREQRYEIKEKLLRKVMSMLDFPLTTIRREIEEDEEGLRVTQIIMPARWGFSDVDKFVKLVESLMLPQDDEQTTAAPIKEHHVTFTRRDAVPLTEAEQRPHTHTNTDDDDSLDEIIEDEDDDE